MKLIFITCFITLISANLVLSLRCSVALNGSGIINVVEKFYLGYCIDPGMYAPHFPWSNFNVSSPKLQTLMKEMGPAILRLGGSPADSLFFDIPFPALNATHLNPSPGIMQKQDLLGLLELAKATNNILLFDLNVRQRYGYSWDPSNAIRLMTFIISHNLTQHVAFELGNEPDWLLPELITPARLAEDFVTLHRLMQHFNTFQFMVGPDVVSTAGVGGPFLKSVVDVAGQYLKAATFHHYYFRGDKASYKDYLNPASLSNLASNIAQVKAVIHSTKNPTTAIWLGETSDAWHEGTPNVSDRFISAFLWMDKLGLSASLGLGAVMRQTLYGHYYALLDKNLNPNPDYWLSWLFKKFVGENVFQLDTTCSPPPFRDQFPPPPTPPFPPPSTPPPPPFRVYAHCTKPSADYRAGSLTVYLLNMDSQQTTFSFQQPLSNHLAHLYLAQPGDDDAEENITKNQGGGGGNGDVKDGNLHFKGTSSHEHDADDNDVHYDGDGEEHRIKNFVKEASILSKHVRVNGKLMVMPSESSMPTIKPRIFHTSTPIIIPNYSYAFIVFPDIKMEHCLK